MWYRFVKYAKLAVGMISPAVLLVLTLSCSRTIEHPTETEMIIDAPAVPGAITVTVNDQLVRLAWSAATGAAEYRLYRADTSAANFRLYDSTAQTTYTDNNVANNVIYFYRLASVSAGGVEGAHSPSVSARPGVFSLAINNDNEFTNTLSVTLSLTVPGSAGSVRLSNTAQLENRPWLAYASSKSWELAPGDGAKTVYAQFRDAAGATSDQLIFDEIELDTRAVIDSVLENSADQPRGAGETVLFTVVAGEPYGDASVDAGGFFVECFDDGTHGDQLAVDGRYQRSWEVPTDADFEAFTVIGRFTDRAGNTAENVSSATLLTVRRAPDPVTAFASPVAFDQIEVSWSSSDADDFALYRVFRAETAIVDENSKMVFSTSSKTTTSYLDDGLDAATEYFYAVWVYDRTAMSAPSTIVSASTESDEAPDAVEVSVFAEAESRIAVSWTASSAEDFAFYRVFRAITAQVDDNSTMIFSTNVVTVTSYVDTGLDYSTTYYYGVTVYDQAGQSTISGVASTNTWANTAPDPVIVSTPIYVDTTQLRITWSQSSAEDFLSYKVYRSLNNSQSGGDLRTVISDRTRTEYVDENDDLESDWYYWVVVVDDGNLTALSQLAIWNGRNLPPDPVVVHTPRDTVILTIITIDETTDTTVDTSLFIRWESSTAPDFKSYRVYRSLNTQSGDASPISDNINAVDSTSFVDPNVDIAERYYYWIRVYDIDGLFSISERVAWEP